MSSGISILNDDFALIIDDSTYFCQCLRQSGSLTASDGHSLSSGTPNTMRTAEISYSGGSAPIFVIRKTGASSGAAVLGVTQSGGNWTFKVGVVSDTSVNDFSFSYFIYDRPVRHPGAMGVEVADAAGNLTFSTVTQQLAIMPNPAVAGSTPGTYGFAFVCGIRVVNDTIEISTSDGGSSYVDRWRADLDVMTCQGGVLGGYSVTIGQGLGHVDYSYPASEAKGGTVVPALAIDLSDVV